MPRKARPCITELGVDSSRIVHFSIPLVGLDQGTKIRVEKESLNRGQAKLVPE
jgi:hypothetical protein